MSDADRDRWDARYRAGAYAERRHPTVLLAEWLPRLPRGRALDVACGAGRNALFLAAAGFEVDAMDISSAALERARADAAERGLAVQWLQADLDTMDTTQDATARVLPRDRRYDLIVWVRYVNDALMPHLAGRLREGGLLLCEQHLSTARRDVAGPRTPGFRVGANALLQSARGLRVLFYREAVLEDPDGRPAALAQLVACRGAVCDV